MAIETLSAPYRVKSRVDKRHEKGGPVYEVSETMCWYEPDGTEITDAKRIEELEAGTRRKETDNGTDDNG